MDVEINLLGVLLAAVSAMIVGAIWYAKGVFGEAWMKMAGIDEGRAKKEGPMAMAAMFVVALVAAYVLSYVTFLSNYFFVENSYLTSAVQSAFWVWLGFVVYSIVGNGMFEQKRKKLILINLGNSFVTFMLMGLVIGWVGL